MTRPQRLCRLALLATAALLAAACSAGERAGGGSPATSGGQERFVVMVASYDLAAGPKSRFLVGLPSVENRFIAYGQVGLGFAYLGADRPATTGTTTMTVTASYLPVPGSPPVGARSGPAEVSGSEGRGVYAAQVAFDRPGYWGVQVTADLEGSGPSSATATFQVLPAHRVPAVGQPALRTRNHVVGAPGVPRPAIDSRAGVDQGAIPDLELHRLTIEQAVARRRPAVVVFSTPVYCVSQFCGPVTDMVAGLARRYGSQASFVHVEIWRDFERKQLNKAAADWLYRGGDLQEPWVFVLGADGQIAARFDNVATQAEVEGALRRALQAEG